MQPPSEDTPSPERLGQTEPEPYPDRSGFWTFWGQMTAVWWTVILLAIIAIIAIVYYATR